MAAEQTSNALPFHASCSRSILFPIRTYTETGPSNSVFAINVTLPSVASLFSLYAGIHGILQSIRTLAALP